MTEDELREIAKDFRQAIEESNLSEESIGKEAHLRVGRFPTQACMEISEVLGTYLKKAHNLIPLIEKVAQIEDGEEWLGTHHWLEHNEIIIDLTADQFDIISDKVIVSSHSAFHNNYAKKIDDITESFDLKNEPDWFHNIYNEIVPRYEAIVAAKSKA